jgi:hypothetical protein
VAAVVSVWRHGTIEEIVSTVLAGGLAVCAYGLALLAVSGRRARASS